MKPVEGSTGAVTLVELLVALTITAGLAALLLSVTSSTVGSWRRAHEAFTTDVEAKLALDHVERDFQSLVFRPTGGTWMAVDVTNAASGLSTHGWRVTGTIKPATAESLLLIPPEVNGVEPKIGDARFGLSGVWWRFIASNIETKGSGIPGGSQPVAMSYQIARRPVSGPISATNPADVRYTLFRSTVAADVTFSVGFDVTASGFGSSSSASSGARSARSLTNPNIADALASNVVDFGVWLYARNSGGTLQRLFPASPSDVSHTATQRSEFPDVADIMIRVLTPEGADLVAAMEAGSGAFSGPTGLTAAEWWWSVVQSHSRVYVRRVAWRGGQST
ncbi:MAG: hypothetical protein ABIV50_13995, partial [Opitutus sp.]